MVHSQVATLCSVFSFKDEMLQHCLGPTQQISSELQISRAIQQICSRLLTCWCGINKISLFYNTKVKLIKSRIMWLFKSKGEIFWLLHNYLVLWIQVIGELQMSFIHWRVLLKTYSTIKKDCLMLLVILYSILVLSDILYSIPRCSQNQQPC